MATPDRDSDATMSEPTAKAFDDLPPAAQRALREAQERRRQLDAAERDRQQELGGRGGRDPARYGDWEVKGVAVDF